MWIYSQQTFSCRLNVLRTLESLKVWTTVMLNKCLNMLKSFTSMTTSCFFLLYFLVHFSSLLSSVTSNAGIALFRHHVINLSQSQCVLTLTVSVTPANQVNRVGTRSDRSHPAVNHSLTANHLVQHRKLTGKDTSCFWRPVIGRLFGLIVSPDVPENEEVMWSVFFF